MDYILKPAKNKELIEVFTRIREELEQRHAGPEEMQVEHMILDILTGSSNDADTILKHLNIFGIQAEANDRFAFILFELEQYSDYIEDNWEYGKDKLYNAIKNFLHDTPPFIDMIPVYRVGEQIPVLVILHHGSDLEMMRRVLEDVLENIRSVLGLHCHYHLVREFRNVQALAEAAVPVYFQQSPQTDEKGYIDEIASMIVVYVREGDKESFRSFFESSLKGFAFETLQRKKYLLSKLCQALEEKFEKSEIGYIGRDLQVCMSQIRECKDDKTLAAVREKLFELLNSVLMNCALHDSSAIVEQIKRLVDTHFGDDITLEYLAGAVFLTPAYISKLFKQKMGENISDYLLKVRMEYAKKLLCFPNIKVYEICEKTGYKAPRYFYRIFKKYTGMTPTEYREKYLKES